jgi:8-oxo-dGTP pyrophosphatase MutT (NUDIX family)
LVFKIAEMVTPRPASSLLLLRDSAEGPEVLMVRRTSRATFMPASWVFPGGALEPSDIEPERLSQCVGLTDTEASSRLGLQEGGLAWFVAAIRECYEECGLLIAVDREGAPVSQAALRRASDGRTANLATNTDALDTLLVRKHVLLACGDLAYIAHWITPEGSPRRFDTRFFVARAPIDQVASVATTEHTALVWIQPKSALLRAQMDDMLLQGPTKHLLGELANFSDVHHLMKYARSPREFRTVRPPP